MFLFSRRFVSMEKLRPASDKLKALLTNKGLYIVRSGPPTPEHIDIHVEYALFVDAVVVSEGKIELILPTELTYYIRF